MKIFLGLIRCVDELIRVKVVFFGLSGRYWINDGSDWIKLDRLSKENRRRIKKYKFAVAKDFKPGLKLIDRENNEFVLDREYSSGVWESRSVSGETIIFKAEAKHYRKIRQ